ncbi:type II toxin-antitoxin system VapC family toxin [Spirosoma foliorum]|uniref:Ribonuclease VapC n=1 Tax=Spirosoma foliorum TaxID=2710596 RepID=A0A7G5H2B7_9BACT|nr:type II toxin-antitoxin system VapC family toxin [Spirosoma foliorum]QMW05259.1 type II toxin-antitoxin system VapC family toxin [Spirosoma foliorum]
MKERLFCDTNALIRLLEGDALVSALLAEKRIYISAITEMEMQCKPNIKASERAIIRDLLSYCIIVDLTDAIKDRAIKVRLSTRLKLMDAIVGASAIEAGLPLVTADEKFSSLRGTDVIMLPQR